VDKNMLHIDIEKTASNYYVEEAYKTLRTNVLFCGDENQVLAITSCTPDEGKSTISFELAASLAEAGKKVLFIDADLRKSVIIGRLKIKGAKKGFTHYLSGQNPISEVIYETNIKMLHMILAGPVPPNPAELLGGKHFKALIPALRKVYDYIIIDTPPLGSVIDCAIIAKECDGAIMVIEYRKVSHKFAKKVKDQLSKVDLPLLGVIMNKVNITNKRYYNKYYAAYSKK